MKTENLAIILTDIVGYTERTSKTSRQDHEDLMASHDKILLPVVKKFKGQVIQRIGDAYLLVFKSPTDAMLCGMAMQDALYEFNQTVEEDREIHIRVAASLGEVRVAKKDIFGEQVNITSRIESITPPDEIYFSDAIYMAMNKAEVSAEEVGWKEFKGISEKCRVWKVPRFSTLKLVPSGDVETTQDAPLVYPYGGAHHREPVLGKSIEYSRKEKTLMGYGALAAILMVVGIAAVLFLLRGGPHDQPSAPPSVETPLVKTPVDTSLAAPEEVPVEKAVESTVEAAGETQVERPSAASVVTKEPAVEPKVTEGAKETVPAERQPVAVTPKPPPTKRITVNTKLAANIRSGDSRQIKAAFNVIKGAPKRHAGLIGIANVELLRGFSKGDPDRSHVQAMGWLCHILGVSGDPRYRPTLEKVAADAPHRKLRGYARKDLAKLE